MAIVIPEETPQSVPNILRRSRAILHCRICGRVLLVAIAAIVVIEAVILVPSISGFEQDALSELEKRGRIAVEVTMAALANDGGPIIDTLPALLGEATGITGIAAYRIGDPLARTVGETPKFTPGMFRSLGEPSRAVDSGDRYELLVEPAGVAGLQALVLRLNSEHVAGDIKRFFWRILGLVLVIAGFVGAAIVGSTWKWIVQPIISLRDVLTWARTDPLSADRWRLRTDHQDEIGELYHEANELLAAISGNYRDDVAAMSVLANRASDAILVFDAKGHLIFGNDAWRSIGTAERRDDQPSSEPHFKLPDESAPKNILGMLDGASFHGSAHLVLDGERSLLCRLDVVRVRFGLVALLRPSLSPST